MGKIWHMEYYVITIFLVCSLGYTDNHPNNNNKTTGLWRKIWQTSVYHKLLDASDKWVWHMIMELVWPIWMSRNDWVINGKQFNILQVLKRADSDIVSLEHIPVVPESVVKLITDKWKPPDSPSMKANIDAATKTGFRTF
ncbi:hypothetical protein TanjilG_04336 [Lupinus angustifolius]|uniref:Uncharacterized protein n=1 Tax=Lupinus angustifolius TaxID=3871 RepID=A0A4P1RPS2_LUPAN|nr:hypothetical protein TanjilG_04336 [Lupinus angustifolius]